MDSVFCVVELFFSFCKNNSHKKKTAHLLGGDTEFSDVNETIGFVKNEVCVYLVPWSWNCVDYVAHTCAVPEGRAATENVGDRQEWFKTDLGASLSLSSTHSSYLFGVGLPTTSSSLLLLSSQQSSREGRGKICQRGGGTRRRTEGGGPRGIDHQPTQDTPKTSSSSSSSKQVYTLPHWRRGLTVLRIHMRRRRRRRRIICVREMEKKGIISPTVDKIRD